MRGHIRQRGKNSWAVIVRIPNPITGKSKPKWHTVRGSYKDAEKELTRILREIDTNTYIEPQKTTLADYLRKWLKRQERNLAPNTLRGYRTNLEKHVIPYIGEVPLTKVKPAHIDDLFNETLASTELSNKTLLYVFRTLHKALEDAVRREEIFRNPAANVERPKPDEVEIRILESPEEIVGLVHALGNSILLLPSMVMLSTGLRRGEALGLRWSDLDLNKRVMRVCKQLQINPQKKKLELAKVKTKTSKRPLQISKLTVQLFKIREIEQDEERRLVGSGWNNKHDLVFTWPDGSSINPSWFTKEFHNLVRNTPLQGLTPHGLRHSLATLLLVNNQNMKLVQEQLRHSNITITSDTYSHLLPPMQEQLANCIDSSMGQIMENILNIKKQLR